MAFSGGTYTLPAGNPVTAGNTIEASWANTTLNDIATALSTCVLKDGTQTLTANIPMAGFKLTGLAAGSSANDSVRMAQLQGGSVSYLTGTAGTNTVTALGTPTVTALTTGQRFTFIPANTNTAATTLQVDSTSALSVFWNNAALVGGELQQNVPVTVLYDGTQYQLIASGAMANTFATPDTWRLQANGDRTKQVAFSLTGISTATTRTITMVDANVDLQYARAASTIVAGGVELLTQAEYDAGTDTTRAPTASLNRIALGTEQATTSGIEKDFTGIPAGTRRIKIMFVGVSTNGSSIPVVVLGDAGGFEASGYSAMGSIIADGASPTVVGQSVAFPLASAWASTVVIHGEMTLSLEDSAGFTWVCSYVLARSDVAAVHVGGGSKSLSAELTQLRITMLNGTDAFDAGAINIQYER